MRDLILALVKLQNAPNDQRPGLTAAARELIATHYPELIKAPDIQEGDLTFTVYWQDGTRTLVYGPTIEAAFTRAGFGAGAVPAIDWYAHGDDNTHEWSPEIKTWVRREPLIAKVG